MASRKPCSHRVAERHGSISAILALLVWLGPLATALGEDTELQVYAAASLTDAVDAIARRYEASHDVAVTGVYAASGTLARQIANGAPADLFIPAHPQWLDWLSRQGVGLGDRVTVAGNRLALIAPNSAPNQPADVAARLADAVAGDDRVAIGHPAYVPAGMYARQALESLGYWQALRRRLVRASSARATIAMVARGGITLGLAYRSDARLSEHVRLLGLLPRETHDPIRYPAVAIGPASDQARAFQAWLGSKTVRRIIAEHGFDTEPEL